MTGWWNEVREHYAVRGLGGRLRPGARPAVVVVDLIRGFTDPACPPGSDLDAVVAATRQVLDVARAADVPVFFTSIAFTPAELDTTLWLTKMPAMRVLVPGSDWVEVDERLALRADEAVITKRAASGFNGTDLAGRLAAAGADSLVLCGATTSGCIRATAIDACALGLPTFVPRECVGDRAAGPHEANLLDIDAKYADVVELADALALLRAPVADGSGGGR
ncbi:isochorismatase family protein [Pseudonocardia bannensis]|uniref:Isochorismatase family protein n=1 Tax=Pseudonocardia bannensis TaxID=630973 RepID=A0A848DK86_9PSEU|nr:isochorismatase family protein [Pseudonocardia bannensis]NMH93140.1 isochorismatase family protein [Pseudonocardia bannensis]